MEFEVFLSFRGPDTRDNFTSCLYCDMKEKGIRVFKDDEELHVGQKIGGNLLRALEETQIYIPIFSKGFASSPWCLREIAHMVDCTSKSDGKKEILPVFFDVKPDDVKLKTNLYRDALSEHEKKYDSPEVKRWRDALVEVPTRLGWRLEGKGYGEVTKLIVQEVLLKLKGKNRLLPDYLVETNDLERIEELLDVDANDQVRFVIIHGTGGIGKTTLASVIFNKYQSKFNFSSFLGDVQSYPILDMQKKLLSETVGSSSTKEIYDTDGGSDRIKRGLGNKKVLVVVDNVDEKKQLEKLAGSCDWFGSGSRIIVTLRDIRIIRNKDNQARPNNYKDYSVQEMPFDLAIQLFSKHAFRSDTPPNDCYEFSEEVVSSIGRLPLTLEVVGSLFSNTARSKWNERLDELKQAPHKEVRETLMISIKKLDNIEKDIFLDIACFCIGENKTYAEYMWCSSHYSSRSAIDVLLLMSLIKINEDEDDEDYNTFWMHDEVRDLGRYIVKEENFEDAGACRLLQIDENTLHVLLNNEVKRAVQALNFGISHQHHLTSEECARLPMLRFLRGGFGMNFLGDFKNLLCNLRWLVWHYCPEDFSPMNFHPLNLVVLDLSFSYINHDWDGWKQIEVAKKLKVLDLSYCYGLTKTPDFSKFAKLEKLILCGCVNLVTIDRSLGNLKLLKTLDVDGCRSLQGLFEMIGSLECLSEIFWPSFENPIKLPETLGNLTSLTKIEIYGGINQVPHSIGRLNLTDLVLSDCMDLHELPDSIGELEPLVKLDLRRSRISVLPDSIGKLRNLQHLCLSSCNNLRELPESMNDLESLLKLDLNRSGISVLLDSIGKLRNLQHLLLSCCNNLCELPESIGDLESLLELDLNESGISVLSHSIGKLRKLQRLCLSHCKNLHKLPETIGDLESLSTLDLNELGIYVLPDSIGKLKKLQSLCLPRCKNLHKLPETIGDLESLLTLNLYELGISILPDSIGKLKKLQRLCLPCCKNLHKLPETIGDLESLLTLDLNELGISVLPDSIGKLRKLQRLCLPHCKNLHKLPETIGDLESLLTLNLNELGISVLPDSIGKLRKLQRLWMPSCKNLHKLPETIGDLESLLTLDLNYSIISILPDSIGKLRNLKNLYLSFCYNLRELPESIGDLESLLNVDLNYSGIRVLPHCFGKLKNFTNMSLFEQGGVGVLERFVGEPISPVQLKLQYASIPLLLNSIERLTSFTYLSFSGCKGLHELPNSIGQMILLIKLDLKSSNISVLPDSIGNLKRLEVLNVAHTKIRTIPSALGGVETLEELDASFCPNLTDEIPWGMWSLPRLRILDLDGSPISTVPRNISGFSGLQTLKIASHRLSPLPDLPSSLECLMVAAAEFPVLPDLSSLVHLRHLEVRKEEHMTFSLGAASPWKDADSVDRLPLSLSTLKLHSIPQLPDFSNFQSLLVLFISGCLTPCLRGLSRLKSLQELWLSDLPELVEVPGLGELESLAFLHISRCDVIKQLPNLSKLKDLWHLELKHCAELRTIEGLKELENLENVEIIHCMSLERFPDVSTSIKLKTDWMPLESSEHTTIQPAKRLGLSLDFNERCAFTHSPETIEFSEHPIQPAKRLRLSLDLNERCPITDSLETIEFLEHSIQPTKRLQLSLDLNERCPITDSLETIEFLEHTIQPTKRLQLSLDLNERAGLE